MKKSRGLLLVSLLFSLLLSGCWDRREINDMAFVVATSVDKEDGNLYRVSVQIPLPSQLGGIGASGGGGGTSGDKPWIVESATGRNVREANDKQQAALPRVLYFAHRRVLLIGDALAREGVQPYMDVLGRVPQNRLTAFVLITEGSARDVLNADAPYEQFPAEMMRELAQSSMKRPRTVKHFVGTILTDGIDPTVPVIRLTQTKTGPEGKPKSSIQVKGLAIFNRQNRLVGVLEREEAKGVLMAMSEANAPTILLPSPAGKGEITLSLQDVTADLKPTVQNGQITVRFILYGRGSVVENESQYEMTWDDNALRLNKLMEDKVSRMIMMSIRKLQQELHADPIGIGRAIHMHEPDTWRSIRGNWEAEYAKIKIEVESHLQIEHMGTIRKPFSYREKEWVKE